MFLLLQHPTEARAPILVTVHKTAKTAMSSLMERNIISIAISNYNSPQNYAHLNKLHYKLSQKRLSEDGILSQE